MYDRLPGHSDVRGETLTDDAIRDWGTMAARVGRGLRGLFHPLAQRVMLWDVQHALRLRPMLTAVPDADVRRLVSAALDRYEQVVTPVWPGLRAQIVHTDLCASNVLVDEAGRITGVIDFGDASWSALVVDLAAVLETVTEGREADATNSSGRPAWLSTATRRSRRWSRESGRSLASCSPLGCVPPSSSPRRGRRCTRRRMRSWLTCAVRPQQSCACSSRLAGMK